MKYETDKNGDSILTGESRCQQVMMEFEKPYMEKCIDALKVEKNVDDCLEVGFGMGYSATRFLEMRPRSYTIVECDPEVVKRVYKWRDEVALKISPNTEIDVIESRWQESFDRLGNYSCVFFDDFPLDISEKSDGVSKGVSECRFRVFFNMLLQNQVVCPKSRISCYMNDTRVPYLGASLEPFLDCSFELIDIFVSDVCNYRTQGNSEALVPLFIVKKKYDIIVENAFALKEMERLKNRS